MGKNTKTPKKRRKTIVEEFCVELDIFSEGDACPEWVYRFRENLIRGLRSELVRTCRQLKSHGIELKILQPIGIGDKWKYADIYIPKYDTVVMVTTKPHPAGWLTERARFFTPLCKVYELDGYEAPEHIDVLVEKIRSRSEHWKHKKANVKSFNL